MTKEWPVSPSVKRSELGSYMNGHRIEHNLTNHPPLDLFIEGLYEDIRTAAKRLGDVIDHAAIDCREKSLALTSLEQCVMWAVASIDRNQVQTLELHEKVAA